jgi:NADPH:quinone reductase-like Zn-dependent oxidoreductase
VSGGAGGVGTAGVQLAAQAGAIVVASVRDRSRHEGVAALGAHAVIQPGTEAEHGPYDVVLELVGAPSLTAALSALAIGARVVVIGMAGGAEIELNLFALMGRRATIGGSTLRARSRTEKANVAMAVSKHVLPLLDDGRLRVPVCDTFPMSEAEAAYARFVEGAKLGKVVLVND